MASITGEFVARLAERAQGAERDDRVHESRAVIGDLLETSRASAHFLDNPLQRINRDVDVICGHVVFATTPAANSPPRSHWV